MDCMAELTWAKVAGHDYGVTIFQYQEIMHHIDPELMWIVNEAVSKFMEPDASKTYRVYDLFYTVARELLPVIVEREKAEAKPNFGEVAEAMFQTYVKFPGNKKGKTPTELVNEFLFYGIKRAIILVRFYNRGPDLK